MEGLQSWISEHKLMSIATLWVSAVGGSVAYSSSRVTLLKPSLRLIHARMHAQALTLAVLSGAAAYHYYQEEEKKEQENHHHHDSAASASSSPVAVVLDQQRQP